MPEKIPLDLEPEDMPDLRSLTPEELEKVPFVVLRWHCCVKDCDRFTRVKDYGILPVVLWRHKWQNLAKYVFYCADHWPGKLANRLRLQTLSYKDGAGVDHLKPNTAAVKKVETGLVFSAKLEGRISKTKKGYGGGNRPAY